MLIRARCCAEPHAESQGYRELGSATRVISIFSDKRTAGAQGTRGYRAWRIYAGSALGRGRPGALLRRRITGRVHPESLRGGLDQVRHLVRGAPPCAPAGRREHSKSRGADRIGLGSGLTRRGWAGAEAGMAGEAGCGAAERHARRRVAPSLPRLAARQRCPQVDDCRGMITSPHDFECSPDLSATSRRVISALQPPSAGVSVWRLFTHLD